MIASATASKMQRTGPLQKSQGGAIRNHSDEFLRAQAGEVIRATGLSSKAIAREWRTSPDYVRKCRTRGEGHALMFLRLLVASGECAGHVVALLHSLIRQSLMPLTLAQLWERFARQTERECAAEAKANQAQAALALRRDAPEMYLLADTLELHAGRLIDLATTARAIADTLEQGGR